MAMAGGETGERPPAEASAPAAEPATAAAGLDDKGLTPLLQQYKDLKAQNPQAILLFRCGDFYETFFDDAVVAARELQITLTARGRTGTGQPVPLAGVPYHSVMTYVARLVQKGFTVAICEQMEDPKQAKGLVKREVVRILTPGTIADPQLLEEKSNNWLTAFGRRGERFCLAAVELSTGEMIITSGDKVEMGLLPEEFTRLSPREVLLLEGGDDPLEEGGRCGDRGRQTRSSGRDADEPPEIPDGSDLSDAGVGGGDPAGPIAIGAAGAGAKADPGEPVISGAERRESRPAPSSPSSSAPSGRTGGTGRAAWVPPWQALRPEVHVRRVGEAEAVEALATLFPREPRARFLALPPLELRVLGILAEYLLDTQKCSLGHLRYPQPYRLGDGMVLDEATLRNLELLPDGRERTLGGTLFEVVNRTRTAMGARLLKRWLLKPLIQVAPILERQERVAALHADPVLLAEVREALKGVPDLERLLSRIVLGSRNPRDAQALGLGLARLPFLHERLKNTPLADVADELAPLPDLEGLIARTLRESLPAALTDGGVIADGVDPALDELRGLLRDGDRWLAAFEEKERAATGIKTLRVRKNNVFGYFIEISKGLADKAPAHYVRKQTLTTGERYITAELKEYETKVFSAHDRSIALEKEIYERLVERIREQIPAIQRAAAGLARLDVLASLAWLAQERRFVRPVIVEENRLEIRGGRHPVVEAFLPAGEFHPNDTILDAERRQAIITGPNMAGKSTYLRQTALLVLLAQIGSFVPAESAVIGIVDRIFTRVGASDNLIRGQSTFMVEMMETSLILKNATERSLLILDEIGRGTSTFDGLALAWAILEHINQVTRARTLFATHYHELTDLVPVLPQLFNLNVAVHHDEKSGEMVFLHAIEEGPSNKSYGIEVARLAGLPSGVIDRAREILFELEKTEQDEVGRVTRAVRRPPQAKPQQLSLFAPQMLLAETVRAIDVNNLTPLEALNLLARLKDMANG
ncbi:MAG: DNA mismatch repair protein MutS [Candidatus Ozemobacter sibiricus]|uniref:DNA mismatch repair protein MutS n=1 Tax=Candidatus Ozemobacter sibiricus TaxID=2268124 RepID=A0A367ZSJ8_9BACT|nr:MAG: DNA mismatch repair protein MutS [Candidatus Ozemobacter sibiricus]